MSEHHDGVLDHDRGRSHYRLVLMRAPDGEPVARLSIASVTLVCGRNGARIEDPEVSSVACSPGRVGGNRRRKEALVMTEAGHFHFDCFDALLTQHSRLMEFLLE
jgi:hypothetical protein